MSYVAEMEFCAWLVLLCQKLYLLGAGTIYLLGSFTEIPESSPPPTSGLQALPLQGPQLRQAGTPAPVGWVASKLPAMASKLLPIREKK